MAALERGCLRVLVLHVDELCHHTVSTRLLATSSRPSTRNRTGTAMTPEPPLLLLLLPPPPSSGGLLAIVVSAGEGGGSALATQQ